MPEHELWVTALFNRFLAEPANAILKLFGITPADPSHPWNNAQAMQVFVVALLVIAIAAARRSFSVDNPSKVQTILEMFYGFIKAQTKEMIPHGSQRYVAFFATLFLFILGSNLIGILPTLESPTMFVMVPLGCAVTVFVYYQAQAIRATGLKNWFLHFCGPIWWLSPLMLPIELISHSSRLLSLTVRLYANMFAGEMVFLVFLGLVPLGVPIIFMGLHTFVSFLQAYIFTLLSMVYLGQMVEHEH
jgi:F-type H+-transporting ATPase subunit a